MLQRIIGALIFVVVENPNELIQIGDSHIIRIQLTFEEKLPTQDRDIDLSSVWLCRMRTNKGRFMSNYFLLLFGFYIYV